MTTKRLAFLALFAAINLLAILALRRHSENQAPSISYSRFLNEVEAGQVARVLISRQTYVEGDYLDNRGRFRTRVPSNDPDLYWTLRENGVDMEIDEGPGLLPFAALAPPLLIAAVLLRRRRSRQTESVHAPEPDREPVSFH